ncbi:hypothetical protein LLE49_19405 [Alicyclobacillus tolerans]|uniref:hypothetical protein n=1 Tax=Alicyclobacillus tolerans TaxID=90970 RepID=UPI001F3EE30E|nr:hypothetical protein [Alicyclobacillus tolerans]MCF8566889.1 hypothetical protein [Alicyclobacillus tolerans]
MGTPVPNKRNEDKATVNSPMTTSVWTPEQIEKYFAPKDEEGIPMEFTLTKEQFLMDRLAGKSRAQIAREQGLKHQVNLNLYLKRWNVMDRRLEAEEMEKLQQSRLAVKLNSSPAPVESGTTDEQSETISESPAPTQEGSPITDAPLDDGPQENVIDLSGVEWVRPDHLFRTNQSLLRISKTGIRITGTTAAQLHGVDSADIGFAPEFVVVRPKGPWRVKRDTKSSSVVIPGRTIVKHFRSRGIMANIFEATWNENVGIVIVPLAENQAQEKDSKC